MSTQPVTIDFAKIEGPVYTGRDRGERLRTDLHLDAVDASGDIVEVMIPATTYTISSSFFLGLFGPSPAFAIAPSNFLFAARASRVNAGVAFLFHFEYAT